MRHLLYVRIICFWFCIFFNIYVSCMDQLSKRDRYHFATLVMGDPSLSFFDYILFFKKNPQAPFLKNCDGMTLLHYAAKEGGALMVRILLALGADINARAQLEQDRGVTPLHLALLHGHIKTAGILLAHSPCVDVQMPSGETALQLAIGKRYSGIAGVLLNMVWNRRCREYVRRGQP